MMIEALLPVVVRLGGHVRSLKAGEVLPLSDAQGWKLKMRAGDKVRQILLGPCFSCGATRRWQSIYDAMVCTVCHPPVDDSLVRQWIDGQNEEAPVERRHVHAKP